jgi:hypothetical protein
VTLSAGTLLTADVQVTLPIRIINFLSIDPPPSFSLMDDVQHVDSNANTAYSAERYIAARSHHGYHPRPMAPGLFRSYSPNSRLESLAEVEDETEFPSDNSGMLDEPSDNAYDGIDSEFYGDYYENASDDTQQYPNPHEELDDLSMYEDDVDEVVQYNPQATMDPENSLRFADLYYVSVQEGLDQISSEPQTDHEPQLQDALPAQGNLPLLPKSGSLQDFNIPRPPTQNYPDLRPNARRPIILSRPNRPRGPSSFSQRVHDKMEAAAAAHSANDYGSLEPSQDTQDSNLVMREEHPGPSQPDTLCDPNIPPCFSAQDTLNQPIEITRDAHEQQHDPTTRPSTSRGPAESKHAPCSPVIESTASSAFRSVSESTSSGSRLLPRLPSINASLPVDTPPEKDLAPTAPPSNCLPAHTPHRTDLEQPVQHAEDGGDKTGADAYGGTGTYLSLARPPLVPLAAAGAGSASSVKDKIRELEERVRAVELGDA